MAKIRKTDNTEVKRFKQWLNPKKENNLGLIFNYEDDCAFLKNLLKKIRHIAFIKSIIKFLADHNDDEVPSLIFDFISKGYSKGYRSSLLLILEKYDCSLYTYQILELFLEDSHNTTWYAYDILVKNLKNTDIENLKKISILINNHIPTEKNLEKKEYHELLIGKVNSKIKKSLKLNI